MTRTKHRLTQRLARRLSHKTLSALASKRSVWSFGLFVAIIVVGVAYMMQMSVVTQQVYVLRDVEEEVETLQLAHEKLRVGVSDMKQLSNVRERMQMLGFVPANDVLYITGGDSFAVR